MRLVEKHSEPASVTKDSILEGTLLKIHVTVHAVIDSSLQLYRLKGLRSIWYAMLMVPEIYLYLKIAKIIDKTKKICGCNDAKTR